MFDTLTTSPNPQRATNGLPVGVADENFKKYVSFIDVPSTVQPMLETTYIKQSTALTLSQTSPGSYVSAIQDF